MLLGEKIVLNLVFETKPVPLRLTCFCLATPSSLTLQIYQHVLCRAANIYLPQ